MRLMRKAICLEEGICLLPGQYHGIIAEMLQENSISTEIP